MSQPECGGLLYLIDHLDPSEPVRLDVFAATASAAAADGLYRRAHHRQALLARIIDRVEAVGKLDIPSCACGRPRPQQHPLCPACGADTDPVRLIIGAIDRGEGEAVYGPSLEPADDGLLAGFPLPLAAALRHVVESPPDSLIAALRRFASSEEWTAAGAPERVQIVERLRSVRGSSPMLIASTLGNYDIRAGRWRMPSDTARGEHTMIHWLSDIETSGDTPPALLRALAWPGRLSLLHAREKRGKSTLARFAIAALTRGRDWLDAPTLPDGGRALLISEEHREDVARMMRQPGVQADPSRVAIAPPVSIANVGKMLSGTTFAVVLVDTLTAFAGANGIRDLHGAGDLAVLLADLAAAAKEHDIAIILTHHNRKNPTGDGERTEYRDSTAIGAAADMIISLEDVDHAPRSRRLVLSGRWEEPSLTVTLGPGGYAVDAETELPLDPEREPRPLDERILIHLWRFQEGAGPDKRLSERTIAGTLAQRRGDGWRKAIADLVDGGLIDHVDSIEGTKRRDALKRHLLGYGLTEQGRKCGAGLAAAASAGSGSPPLGGAEPDPALDRPRNIDESAGSAPVADPAPDPALDGGAKVDDTDTAGVLALVDAGYPLGDDAPAEIRDIAARRKAGETLTDEDVAALVAYVDRVAETLIQSGEVTDADGDDYAREVANGTREIVTSYSPPEGADPHRPTCPEDLQAWLRLHGTYVEGSAHVETGPDCQIGQAGARLYRRDRAIILEDPLGEMVVGPRALCWAGMPDEMIAAIARGAELRRGEFGEWRDVSDDGQQYYPVGDATIQ